VFALKTQEEQGLESESETETARERERERERADASEDHRPIEPPEMVLSEDEDDYWSSFKGTASWQRVSSLAGAAAFDSVPLLPKAEAEAGPAAGPAQYSWGASTRQGRATTNPPGTSSGRESLQAQSALKPGSDARLLFDLVIPHPSADGASLNEDGQRMARQLGAFINLKSAESGWTHKPKIFTSTLPRAIETGQVCLYPLQGGASCGNRGV
jgi:hypothetical protein